MAAFGAVLNCLSSTLRATTCTGFSHELATTDPDFDALPVGAGACEPPNMKMGRFGGGGRAVLALPGSDSETLECGCTIRGMPDGSRPSAEWIGVTTAAPGIPRNVCIS